MPDPAPAPTTGHPAVAVELANALRVFLLAPKTRAVLEAIDPMGVKQAESALAEYDGELWDAAELLAHLAGNTLDGTAHGWPDTRLAQPLHALREEHTREHAKYPPRAAFGIPHTHPEKELRA